MPKLRSLSGAIAASLLLTTAASSALAQTAAPPPPAANAAPPAQAAGAAKGRTPSGGTPETDAMVKQADDMRLHGDYQGALRKVHEALAKLPQHPQGLLLEGTLEGALSQFDQAAVHLKQALALMPDNLFARKVYASVLLQKHDTATALEVLGPNLKAKPIDSQAYTMAAQIVATSGDFDQARKYLDRVFAADPGFVPAHELAARIAFSRHQPEEARVQLQAILKSHPDDASALIALADLDAGSGNTSESATLLARARKAQPDQPEPLIASSELALNTGKPDEAAGYIGKLAGMIPESPTYLSLKGQLALVQGHPKDAVAPLQASLAKQPQPEVLVQLHQALMASGQQAEADKRLTAWIEAHPDDKRKRFYAAEDKARRGDFASAAAQFRKILDKEPDNPVALNELARALQAQHDPKALEVAEKACKIMPDSAVTENTLGGILMSSGQAARGLGLLHDAAGHAPQNPDVRFDYARALAANGDKGKARSELEALLALKRPFRGENEARDLLKSLSGG